jgi:signal transduction histidine kinase/DNA-binding response OmpR family regulator
MSSVQSVRILYMEDDRGVARLFQKKLEQLGYTVDLAYDGEQGLAMFDAGEYDLIAVDQWMPGSDGLEVIRILKERGKLPPTIMITGAGDENTAVEALKLGANDYIVKDIDGGYLELLPAVIKQLLNQQQLIKDKEQAVATLKERNRTLALLNRSGQALTATRNLEQLIPQLLSAAIELTGAEGSSVWLWEGSDESWLICQGTYYGQACHSPEVKMALGEGLVGWVAQNDESAFVASPSQDPKLYPDTRIYSGLNVVTLLAVPLRVHDAVIGVLEVVNKIAGDFIEDDVIFIEALANSAGIAIDNARLVERLRDQATNLQARNEELNAFSHTVAHDLKNPLVLTMGYAELVKKHYAKTLDPDAIKYLDQIVQSGHKMRNIIDELLLLSMLRNEEVEPQSIIMSDIIKEAKQRLAYMIQDCKAEITEPALWPDVCGYGPWVEEVWVNYISNALKYGGKPPQIELGATTLENGDVRLWVRDNGPGIKPELLPRLFTPFTRLNQVHAEGHGLGLSIVRRIVEKLGGAVGVESQVGQGSVFSFTLPVAVVKEVQNG